MGRFFKKLEHQQWDNLYAAERQLAPKRTRQGGKGDKPIQAQTPSKRFPIKFTFAEEEAKAAKFHAPIDKTTGISICWNTNCHIGCPFQADKCRSSHASIPNYNGLDEAVQMNLIKRGGLNRNKATSEDQAIKMIQEIRKKRNAKLAKHKKDGLQKLQGSDPKPKPKPAPKPKPKPVAKPVAKPKAAPAPEKERG